MTWEPETTGRRARLRILIGCGWRAIRRGHEPVFLVDPLGCVEPYVRIDTAWELQRKRVASGVAKR